MVHLQDIEMKVLVTGSRHWRDYDKLARALAELRPTVIVHGNARGADEMSGEWARRKGIFVRKYPADWVSHGKAAGPIRNEHMFTQEHRPDEPIDAVVSCPLHGSKGTLNATAIAHKLGIRVVAL